MSQQTASYFTHSTSCPPEGGLLRQRGAVKSTDARKRYTIRGFGLFHREYGNDNHHTRRCSCRRYPPTVGWRWSASSLPITGSERRGKWSLYVLRHHRAQFFEDPFFG